MALKLGDRVHLNDGLSLPRIGTVAEVALPETGATQVRVLLDETITLNAVSRWVYPSDCVKVEPAIFKIGDDVVFDDGAYEDFGTVRGIIEPNKPGRQYRYTVEFNDQYLELDEDRLREAYPEGFKCPAPPQPPTGYGVW